MKPNRYLLFACALLLALGTAVWLSGPAARVSWPASAVAAGDEHDDHDGHDHGEETGHDEGDDDHGQVEEDDHDDHGDHDDNHGQAEDDGHDEHEETVRLSPEVLAEFGIETAVAAGGTLGVEISLAGEIVVNPNLVAHVVPRAPGIVQAVAREIGDPVQAGEVLAILDSPVLAEAKAAYHSLLQELTLHRVDLERVEALRVNSRRALDFLREEPPLAKLSELESLDLGAQRRELLGSYVAMITARVTKARKQRLHDQKIASDAELQEAESTHEQARADYVASRDAIAYEHERARLAAQREVKLAEIRLLAAERHLHALGLTEQQVAAIPDETDRALSQLEVTAPIGGTVIERHLVRGEQAGDAEPVFVIADFSTVWANLTVHQKELALIRPGMPVRISPAGDERGVDTTLDFISPLIDEATRTATARAAIPNQEGSWRPGTFIGGHVAVKQHPSDLLVPREAIVEFEGKPSVFLRTPDGYEPRPVRTGRRDVTRVEILAGLKPGDVYVARNAFALKAELNKASFGHAGHAH